VQLVRKELEINPLHWKHVRAYVQTSRAFFILRLLIQDHVINICLRQQHTEPVTNGVSFIRGKLCPPSFITSHSTFHSFSPLTPVPPVHNGSGLQTNRPAPPVLRAPHTPPYPLRHPNNTNNPSPTKKHLPHTPTLCPRILASQSRLELLAVRVTTYILQQSADSASEHGRAVRAAADGMDCRAHGQVPPDSGSWVGNTCPFLGSHCVCEKSERIGD